jgi:glutamate-5-semialdehyde dehydrogenase
MSEYNQIFQEVKSAARKLGALREECIIKTLESLREIALDNIDEILLANQLDLARMDPNDPKYDRLLLNEDRIRSICGEIAQVQELKSPLNRVLENKTLENGLSLQKISVPLGVLGIIYEARPNVTFDVFSLALKSGNGLILKGSSEAEQSNKAIISIIHQALESNNIPQEAYQLLPWKEKLPKPYWKL